MTHSYYFCYSKRKSDYLVSFGFKPITIAMNMSSRNVFSLFHRTKELDQAIHNYDQQNDVKNNTKFL
ncbi:MULTISPECIES: DUF5659 domain-containing protein [Bacillaceae]|uniref:DUF5659 domain-containing protein n=1 Tax=Evansella alkalicola TaxID=745819 RepID=A0ABS6K097_9BACI|nr:MULTISPECIES: DUF5659 domain-containing protein [Bacillaceae]MBU9724143.1 hypothetical protein [Bacillus alkalicola]